jgi:hypothetical protein
MTKEEYNKTKQELEAEYLATFKKTVAMHEVFLQRLASHPKFKNDQNFRIFLGYNDDVSLKSMGLFFLIDTKCLFLSLCFVVKCTREE